MNKRTAFNFSTIFEILIWVFYVALYKYSYLIENSGLQRIPGNDFPYPMICLFGICSTLPIIPYYRWAIPKLLHLKKYIALILITVVYFIFMTPYINMFLAWIFRQFTYGSPVYAYFDHQHRGFFSDWNLIMTDSIAFLSIAFSRFSYQNEVMRHKVETDHLKLQLDLLKAQLQPHFLFNTLNSLYGMSLAQSKDTSRFILLLSQMMQYILYDGNQEEVPLSEEVNFLKGYFEIEQKKFPEALIRFNIPETIPDVKVPPLLFLPLVENAFKHGRHKLENKAGVTAGLLLDQQGLFFKIENEMLPPQPLKSSRGGIGLVNIRKRLELYYPGKHKLRVQELNGMYTADLSITLK